MNKFTPVTLILGLLLAGCNQANNTKHPTAKVKGLNSTNDKEDLQRLVRDLYQWHETDSLHEDFEPIADDQDSIYVGIDLERHKQRLTELKQTGLFAEEFLNNYNKIALTIDRELKSKKLKWSVGDLPPFGNNANPWCNCQDNPDNYWQTLTINRIAFNNNTTSFIWTWGDNFTYKVKALKENNDWKISYLQGFDFEDFVPIQ